MKYVIFFVCLLCLFSCRYNEKKVINVQHELFEKFEKQKQFLHEQAIPSISIVLQDTIFVGRCVLLLYGETDCDNCVKKGFAIINKLDSLNIPNIFVLTPNNNPGRYQLLYDYHKYIYVDKQDLIRKDLKYITTPILIALDENKKVQQVLFPGISSESEDEIFIKNCFVDWCK